MTFRSRRLAANEELRRRLTEAEEALEAIRNGAVDALVLSGSDNEPRVYTLEGADRPYRLLIEQMQQGAATLNPDGTIAYCNPRLAALLGLPAARVNGSPLASHVAPADRSWLETLLRDGRGGTTHGETHLLRVNGPPVPAYLTVSALLAGAGTPLCVLVTDLTDAKYEDLYEHAPDMMYSVDAVTGCILQCNDTLAAQLGYDKQELLGRPVLDLYEPAARERLSRGLAGFLGGGDVHDDDLRVQCKDGRAIDVSVRVSPVRDAQGRLVRSRAVLRDITDRKRAEAALREADRRKDEFLAVLSHELRNPLAVISSAVELMHLQPGLEDLHRSRDVIDRQVTQLIRLVDDLLDISRITRNKIQLKRERVALAPLVERALESARPLLLERGHRLTLDLPAEPLWLDVDPARIAQVLSNLLINAAKYTAPGGHIALQAAGENDTARVSVRDDGIGIPRELQPRVFDLFVQAQAARERAEGGLGIGLTLVRSLAELHGGSVAVHSDGPGCGSEFTVRLPRSTAPAAVSAAVPAPDPVAARRVMVVDDNADAAAALASLLQLLGHQVTAAGSGAEAIARVSEAMPDVILMDLGMPGMNGFEAAQRIRARDDCAGITLVALTGWGQEGDRERSRRAGFSHHLTKPATVEDLQRLFAGLGKAGGRAPAGLVRAARGGVRTPAAQRVR